jgi:hypothetical protein
MAVTAPQWLTQHGGRLERGSDGCTWFVVFGHGPQYSLVPVPVGSQLGCAIKQTINGSRVASASTAPTEDGAIQAGLEDLRQALGW